jgi:conjugative transfer signal peptidase TraF
MKPRVRSRLARPVAFGLAVLAAVNLVLVAAYAAGLRINTTASMPEGLYRLHRFTAGAIARGTVVAICPSPNVVAIAAPRHYFEPGPCPGNVEPLLKHIAGVAGDTVDVTNRAVSINGRPLPNSGRLARDCAGRPLAHIAAGRYTLARSMVWLYAPVPRSWDSRYFGPQRAADIIGTATPILIVGNGTACSS